MNFPMPLRLTRNVHCTNVPKQLVTQKRWWDLHFFSGTRNTIRWPSTSVWGHESSQTVRNVVSVVIAEALLPIKEYNVNVYGNRVDVLVAGVEYNVELPVGQYVSGIELATALTSAFVLAGLVTFTVSYDSRTDKLRVASGGPVFSLLWNTGKYNNTSLWYVMGWNDRQNTPDAAVQYSTGRIDLYGTQVIDVFIDEFTPAIQGPVARILLKPTGNTTFFNLDRCHAHHFKPIGRVTTFTFRFMVAYQQISPTGVTTLDYRVYDFNGANIYLTVGVETLEYENPSAVIQLDPST